MQYTVKQPINQLPLKVRQGLFARLAGIAYQNEKKATASAKKLGFTKVQFFDIGGAQAYLFYYIN